MAVINIEKMAQNVAEKAMQELRNNGVFVSRWIPVSERLPEEYGEYMITWTTSHSMVNGKYGFLGIAEYELSGEYDHENNRFKGEWLLEDYIKNYPDVKVTAWMPLPEPYKAESEDSAKIDCSKTKCENCKNHNYCDYESQGGEKKE